MHKARRFLLIITAVFAILTCGCFFQRLLPGQPIAAITEQARPPAQSSRIDINSAPAELLQTLPGIGPALSEAIIHYREENGPFQKVGDLILVPGIGQGRLEKILDKITVGG